MDGININEEVTSDYEDISQPTADLPTNDDGDYTIDWGGQSEDVESNEDQGDIVLGEVDTYPNDDQEDQQEESTEEESSVEEDEDFGVELGQIQHDNEVDEDEDEDVEYEDDDEYEEESDDNDLPEGWAKLLDFLEEYPGASPEDYIKMTKGYDDISDEQALKMKIASDEGLDPENDADEIDFLYDDKFAYDEDLDSERDIKLRQIAAKKELREARANLEDIKDKYAADLTFKGNSDPKTQEAVDFYEQYQTDQSNTTELYESFKNNTNELFSDNFKGFEFEYGDGKSQRIKVNTKQVAEDQSDISNFINKYSDDNGNISDVQGYHKALWAANNVDAVFSHAYEQGKADAVRSSAKNAKNIDMGARQDASSTSTNTQGKFKLLNEDSNDGFKLNF